MTFLEKICPSSYHPKVFETNQPKEAAHLKIKLVKVGQELDSWDIEDRSLVNEKRISDKTMFVVSNWNSLFYAQFDDDGKMKILEHHGFPIQEDTEYMMICPSS